MKYSYSYILTIYLLLILCVQVFAIDNYEKYDTLFVWATELNIREKPSLESKVAGSLSQGEVVVVLELKYEPIGHLNLLKGKEGWEKYFSGRWVKIKTGQTEGYVFDAYLSKYTLSELSEEGKERVKLYHPDYSTYERVILDNSVLIELGMGIEWGLKIYYIPDLSITEAIQFLRTDILSHTFGAIKWTFSKEAKKFTIMESDGVSYRNIEVQIVERMTIISIRYGV